MLGIIREQLDEFSTIIEQTIANLGKWHQNLVVSCETTHEITKKQYSSSYGNARIFHAANHQ